MISRVISTAPNSRASSFFYVEIISLCVSKPPSLHSVIWSWTLKHILHLVHCKQGHRELTPVQTSPAQWLPLCQYSVVGSSRHVPVLSTVWGVFLLFSWMGTACTSAHSVSELPWVTSSPDPVSVTCVGGTGEHVRPCLLTVPLAFLWRLAVLHAMTYTWEHRAVSFCGITVQVLRSSKNQFIMVLLWRCLTSYKCRIVFTRWYTLRIFSPILWTRLSPAFVECFHWHAVAFGFHILYLSAFCS